MEDADAPRHERSGAVEDDDPGGTRVLRCECGWQSEPARTAEALGAQWDRHRREHA